MDNRKKGESWPYTQGGDMDIPHSDDPPAEATERVEAIRAAGRALRRGNLADAERALAEADRFGRSVTARLRSRLDYEETP